MDTLLLLSMESEYKDLQYYIEVHWLSAQGAEKLYN
jgi:hypothetical protein